MLEILKEWSVPGGLLTLLASGIVGRWRRPGDDDKTSTADAHRAEVEQIAKDSGLEDKWRGWAEHVEATLTKQMDEARAELAAARRELAAARRETAEATGQNTVLTGYAWQLRADITTYGHTPRPWPSSVDPDRRGHRESETTHE